MAHKTLHELTGQKQTVKKMEESNTKSIEVISFSQKK
jgi:hypothetical protein